MGLVTGHCTLNITIDARVARADQLKILTFSNSMHIKLNASFKTILKYCVCVQNKILNNNIINNEIILNSIKMKRRKLNFLKIYKIIYFPYTLEIYL